MRQNFDNLAQSCLTLFVVATLDDWHVVMYNAMDVTEPGQAPEIDHTAYYSLYFLCFIVVGSMLVINLFVGEIVNTYSKVARSMNPKSETLRQWAVAMRLNIEK